MCWKKKKEVDNKQPNVVLILADDLGYGDWSCYGNNEIETPNIDSLADDGIKLGNYYASSAVCTPSRAGLIGGKFPIRYHIQDTLLISQTLTCPFQKQIYPFCFEMRGINALILENGISVDSRSMNLMPGCMEVKMSSRTLWSMVLIIILHL